MKDIVIVEAVRSAVGRAIKGSLAQMRPDELAGEVIAGCSPGFPQVKPETWRISILGCAMPEGEQGSTWRASPASSAACPRSRRA
jgi:acetyl-CoA acyltransferase